MTVCSRIETIRRGDRPDGGFAMLSVILLILVVTVLSIAILSVALVQARPTLHAEKNVRTLAAAQAGIEAAVSQVRHAYTTETGLDIGNIHKLPCTVTGWVDANEDGPRFDVTIAYFETDPADQDAQWREDYALDCYPPGSGPGGLGGLRAVARYAIITSEGFDPEATATADRADRIVEAQYTFELTTRKIAGGRIFDDHSQFCWVADSASVGSFVRYRALSTGLCNDPTDLNSWSWGSDYMIHLAASDQNGAHALCLSGTTAGPMTLQLCTTSSADPLGQRFAWTGEHTWRGQNAANTGESNLRIVSEALPVQDRYHVSVATSAGRKSVNPDSAVGKGNASYETDQVVNQSLFGRCLDVTDVNINHRFMITYPCKQDPSGRGAFDWNHKWYYTEPPAGERSVPTQVTVRRNNNIHDTFCLLTTDTTRRLDVAGGGQVDVRTPRFVRADNTHDCSSADSQWTRYNYVDDNALAYHLIDRHGRCLSSAGPRTTDYQQWNTVIVEECSDSESQMWNVPTDPVDASLSGFEELTGRSSP